MSLLAEAARGRGPDLAVVRSAMGGRAPLLGALDLVLARTDAAP